jgi:hypothetical protein
MSVSVVITNLTASPVSISELYATLGASGSSTASLTISRSVAQLDSMNELKALLDAGTVSVTPTQSSNNEDILSIPLEQHGVQAGLSVDVATEVTQAVVFPKPFPAGVTPVITLTVNKTAAPASRSTVYVDSPTNLGFNIKLDVTTLAAGLTVSVNWQASY